MLGEVPSDTSVIVLVGTGQGLECLAVDLIGTGVVRRQGHIALVLYWVEGGTHPTLQPREIVAGELAVAQVIQQTDEALILLTIDMRQLDVEGRIPL